MPAMPIADSSPPIVVGIRHTSRATSTMIGCSASRVDGERLQRHDGEQEDDRQPGEQDRQGDLVRRLLPVGALDEGDHAVEERLARLGRDAHDDLVGQHPGAAGDGRAVAARLADHRRRLAGDRRLVDGGDALDDVAVAGDHLAGGDDAQVADLQLRRRHLLDRAVGRGGRGPSVSLRVLRSVAAWALPRPSAIASAKLANSTVNHRNTTTSPANTFSLPRRVAEVADEQDRRQHRADLDDEHHRVAGQRARVELARTTSSDAGLHDAPVEERAASPTGAGATFGGRWPGTGAGCGASGVSVAVIVDLS